MSKRCFTISKLYEEYIALLLKFHVEAVIQSQTWPVKNTPWVGVCCFPTLLVPAGFVCRAEDFGSIRFGIWDVIDWFVLPVSYKSSSSPSTSVVDTQIDKVIRQLPCAASSTLFR